jgi:squalene synthase HpnC
MDLAAELERFGPAAEARPPVSLDEARRYCRRLAESHYENFTVVSWLWPRHLHQHLANVYAYCRWADDLADESADPAQSLELLDWWEASLRAAAEGDARHPVFVALAETLRAFDLPLAPFLDLLAAFRRDQRQTRYETFDELLDYCRCSANPVGRIALFLGRSQDDVNAELSDAICTGLQLANFCQDVRRDFAKGRIYIPLEDCRAAGCREEQLAGPVDDALRSLLRQQVVRAREFLERGQPLVGRVSSDLRLPVRLFVDGGLAILRAIERQGYDVWTRRPTVSRAAKLRLLAGAWLQARFGRAENRREALG